MYLNRSAEGWKQCDLHPARQWASSLLVAEENFERECQEKSDRRLKAEDIALYNKAQAVIIISNIIIWNNGVHAYLF